VRIGAGRKPKLDLFDRIAVGSECENRFNQIWVEGGKRAWSDRKGMPELRATHEEFRAISASERPAFRSSDRGRELAEEVEEAVRALRKTPEWVGHPSRLFSLTTPRPKGVKEHICQDVAAHYSATSGLALTARFVQGCWDDYRRFERRFEREARG
jgi:hypothetical protein